MMNCLMFPLAAGRREVAVINCCRSPLLATEWREITVMIHVGYLLLLGDSGDDM